MTLSPLPWILEIEPYKGGEATLPGIATPIKLASNENAFGPSPKAMAAFAAAAQRLHIYPEGSAQKLREALASKHGLDAARIVCGAGSDELFFLLTRAFVAPGDEVVTNEHAFGVYPIATLQSGGKIVEAKDGGTQGLDANVDALLAAVTPKTKILFLANPNNPTGTYLPASEIARLHRGLPENVLLVIDGAYAEFVDRPDFSWGIELADAPNVFLTRTFSKIYGLAALRIGWGYGAPVVIDALNRVRGPFNVSISAMEAAIAALDDQAFADMSADHVREELPRVTAALEQMGLGVTPSVCNFVLAHFAHGQAAKADAYLRSKGYILRAMKSYKLPDALRMTIGPTEHNSGALAALAEFMTQP
ncbi:biosynthetic aromatic amino acid aminotransferase beta [alpha proteobacterium U9-1i]|nr:biosynthetic aromatic amino acid aminotransferase beta [alpha proteobacterium U9-1i]